MDFGEGRCSAYGSLRCKKGPRQRDGHSDAAGNHNTDEGSECFHHLLHAHTKSSFNFTLNTTNALSTQYTTDLTKSSLTNTTNSSRSLDPHSIRPSCLSSKRVSHLHLLRRRSLTLRRFRLPQGGRRPRRIPCSPRDALLHLRLPHHQYARSTSRTHDLPSFRHQGQPQRGRANPAQEHRCLAQGQSISEAQGYRIC